MNNFVLNERNHDSDINLMQKSRYNTFFDQSVLPMKIYSFEGQTVVTNKAWNALFSISDFDFQNSDISEACHRAANGEASELAAFWFNSYWLEAWISPIKDDLEVVSEIVVILKDVTEKVETQKALVKSISDRKITEEKFKRLSDRLSMAVKAGNIGIWELIPDTNHVYLDETSEEMFGFSVGEFPGTSEAFTSAIHPEDRDLYWSTVVQALRDKISYRIDIRILKSEGVQRWTQFSGKALYDDLDRPYHMLGTAIDISDRVEAEADHKFLSQASELLNCSLDYREILKTISDHAINYFCDGVVIDQLLSDGDIKRLMVVHSNPNLVKQLMKLDELPDRIENNPAMNTIITGKSLFTKNVDGILDSLGTKSSIRVRLKGRESILGTISFFTQKNSGKILTKRHIWLSEELAYRASMAFENALIHLASQEAIRSRDEFLSIASHELKTPLQSLTLQNQMRKRNLGKKLFDNFIPEKISGMIDADLRQLMRINRLIDDMLDISRLRAGKLTYIKEKTDFCAFVKDVLERFRPQIETVGSNLSAIYCGFVEAEIDIYRTEQVLVNLLTNAMKYGAGKPIKVEIIKKQDKLQVQIHDKGPGIREEDMERIFDRFERAISSSEVSGLGLGLYISRQIMEQNQGTLFVRSIIGQGSTFIMELPIEG